MKFGKVDHINDIDFFIPEDHLLTKQLLKTLPPIEQPQIFIGCPVWGDKSFVGKVYPFKTKSSDFLKYYCRQFNTIELNATHYQVPSVTTIKKWVNVATQGFHFCPKWPQLVSHKENFQEQHDITNYFLDIISSFDEYLGYSFIQFPPHFTPDRLADLYQFLEQLPDDFKIAVELRHPDWFNQDQLKLELY